jgi:hypothetical protein
MNYDCTTHPILPFITITTKFLSKHCIKRVLGTEMNGYHCFNFTEKTFVWSVDPKQQKMSNFHFDLSLKKMSNFHFDLSLEKKCLIFTLIYHWKKCLIFTLIYHWKKCLIFTLIYHWNFPKGKCMTFQGRYKRELQNDLWGGVHLPTPSLKIQPWLVGVSFIFMSERPDLKKDFTSWQQNPKIEISYVNQIWDFLQS